MTTPTVGQTLGRFELQQLLGSSGLVTTYRAHDNARGTQVVVKVLSGYFRGDSGGVPAFLTAMERMQTLRHANIVPLLEVGGDAQRRWLVFEYEPAPSLARHPQPLTLWQALRLLQDVALALDHARGHGAQHGNLKPTNIFVGDEGHARLGEFGMVLLAEASHPLIRSTLNTPHPCYTAPERAQGLSTGPLTDVYSLAVLAYQLLTGRFPIFALGASAMLAKQMTMNPATPSTLNPALPAPVDSVLLRALSRRPEQRPSTASDLVAGLRAALAPLDPAQRLPEPAREEEGAERSTRRGLALAEVAATDGAPAAARATKLCPVCASETPEDSVFCRSCWARIERRRGATLDEARYFRRQVAMAVRRRRLATALVVGLALSAFVFWVVWKVTGPTHFLGPPVSRIASVPAAGEWAMARRDLVHSGAVTTPLPLRGEVAWAFPTQEPLLGSPAVVGGRVYLATGDRRVVALDAGNGRLLWQAPTTGPVDSSPAVAGGLLFLGLRDARLLALEAESGRQLWEFPTGNPIITSPVVAHGTVYIASGDGRLYAIDAQTGKRRWDYLYGGFLLSSPVVVEDAVIAVTSLGVFHVLDAFSGRHRLSYDLLAPVRASPTIHGDRLYLGADNGRVLAWEWRPVEYPFERGWLRWHQYMVRWKILRPPMPLQKGFVWGERFRGVTFAASPVATQDTLYLASTDGRVFALDAQTGDARWQQRTGATFFSSPVLVGEMLYLAARDGPVLVLDAKTGERKGALRIGEGTTADIVVAGDTLYVPSRDGTLYAVR